MFCRVGDAAAADRWALSGRQQDVEASKLADFVKDAAGFVAEAGLFAPLAQRFPRDVGQKARTHI